MATQNDNGDVGDIIDRLYRAATGEAQWEGVLTAITEATNSNYTFFQEHDLSTNEMTRFWHDQCPVEVLDDWITYWYSADPRLDYAQKYPREKIYNDYKIMGDEDAINRDGFYNEFLNSLGVRYHAASSIMSPPGINGESRIAYLGFNRRQSAGHVSQQECELLINLRPHFERALAVEAKLGLAEAQTDILGDTLNALAYGIVIVDQSASIRWANEQAKQLLGTRDGIASERGVLQATVATARKQLGDFIANACGTFLDPRRQPGGAFLIPRELALPIEVLVAPLPRKSAAIAGLVGETQNNAIVFLHEQSERKFNSEDLLMALYGLTRSEAALALELSQGETLKTAADRRGITYETARTQIKTIYLKTDTHTQSQLVSMILRSPASLLKG